MKKTIKKPIRKAQTGRMFSDVGVRSSSTLPSGNKTYDTSAQPVRKRVTKKIENLEKEGNSKNPTLDSRINYYRLTKLANPKPRLTQNFSTDTTGYSSGKKEFPSVLTSSTSRKTYPSVKGVMERETVDEILKNPTRSVDKVTYRRGGKVKKAKSGTMMPKKSSVSNRLGSAKKSIGNRSMKKK